MRGPSIFNRAVSKWATLWLLLIAGSGVCAEVPALFEEANRLYEQGDFEAAKQRYAQLAATGDGSANLFYNLGNAEYRLGEHGRAALSYERALALVPSHPEASRNLAVVRNETGAKLLVPSRLEAWLPRWDAFPQGVVASIAAWVAIGSVIACVRRRGNRLAVGLAAALALAVGAYAGWGIWREQEQRALAIVTAKEATARFEPAENSKVAETLPAGSRVRVKAQRGPFTYCELPSGKLAWMRSDTVETVQPSKS